MSLGAFLSRQVWKPPKRPFFRPLSVWQRGTDLTPNVTALLTHIDGSALPSESVLEALDTTFHIQGKSVKSRAGELLKLDAEMRMRRLVQRPRQIAHVLLALWHRCEWDLVVARFLEAERTGFLEELSLSGKLRTLRCVVTGKHGVIPTFCLLIACNQCILLTLV